LGGNESYPDLFQPYGGFPDGVAVNNGYVDLPMLLGIGFDGKADLIAEMHALARWLSARAPHDVFGTQIPPAHERPERGAGANAPGAYRVGHRATGAIQPVDNTAVGA